MYSLQYLAYLMEISNLANLSRLCIRLVTCFSASCLLVTSTTESETPQVNLWVKWKIINEIPHLSYEFFRHLLRAIFGKSHPTCDSRVFRTSSYFSQLKIKVIPEYGRNFGFMKHFVEFLGGGGRDTTAVFQEMQSVSLGYILKATSAS